ncbi:MAG: hypothetical protein ACR2I1_03650 [Propionibacteriaceae bacterium]
MAQADSCLTSWISGLFSLPWHVSGFRTPVLGSLITSIVSWLLSRFLGDKNRKRVRR